ncbi:MAG TPA: hypothetical protein H9790_09510 [Candidatus Agathobaculum intestinipullorum]|nr:hypothetical protein [Candidatus Agathobaculum intestinipullorum]
MKISVYSGFGDYSISMDMEYDAALADDREEAGKHILSFFGKQATNKIEAVTDHGDA